jgi:peptide/nickel transport system substrate-binding protein
LRSARHLGPPLPAQPRPPACDTGSTIGATASGGTVRIGVPELEAERPAVMMAPQRYSPYYPSIMGFLLLDVLTRLNPTKGFTPEPALASSWTISLNGRSYIVQLPRGVTWRDGAPFTADDVKFTIDLADDPPYVWAIAPDANVVFSTKVSGYHTGFTESALPVFVYANVTQWSKR